MIRALRFRCLCGAVVTAPAVVTPYPGDVRRVDGMHDACGKGCALFLSPRRRRSRTPRTLPLFRDNPAPAATGDSNGGDGGHDR